MYAKKIFLIKRGKIFPKVKLYDGFALQFCYQIRHLKKNSLVVVFESTFCITHEIFITYLIFMGYILSKQFLNPVLFSCRPLKINLILLILKMYSIKIIHVHKTPLVIFGPYSNLFESGTNETKRDLWNITIFTKLQL